MTYPAHLASDVVLRGGSTVTLRPVAAGDEPLPRDFFGALDERSLSFRIFTGAPNLLGAVLLAHLSERAAEVGFTAFVADVPPRNDPDAMAVLDCAEGNRADITANDLLECWEDDEATHVALLEVESFSDPRRLARAARRFGARKPIVVLAAQDADEPPGRGLFDQVGALRVDSVD